MDGRQRKDTFVEMQNPENIYHWAKSYLSINNNNLTAGEITDRFCTKLNEYILFEKNEENSESEETTLDVSNIVTESEDELYPGLRDLLDIICTVHPVKGKNSEFGKPFLVKDYKASYTRSDSKTGKDYVDGNRLVTWLGSKINSVSWENLSVEDVLDWYDNVDDNLRRSVAKNIGGIRNSVRILQKINNHMNNAQILMIELDNGCNAADSRKIFELINTKGSPLTGAEILSAKPSWNDPVDTDDETLREKIDSLYATLGVEVNDTVKWDIAATFTDCIEKDAGFILGSVVKTNFKQIRANQKKQFEQKMTTGFKLLSGRYMNSLTKNDIDKLPEVLDCEGGWSHIELQSEIASVSKILLWDSGFSKFSRAGIGLWDLLSNTVAMNFLFLVIKKWIAVGKPHSKGNGTRQLITFSRALFDRMFYEHCTGEWKGSSDAKLSSNLNNSGDNPEVQPVPEDKWNELIDSLYDEGKIASRNAALKIVKSLLYYFTLVRQDIDLGEGYEVDHIIPKGRIVASNPNASVRDAAINLALLPKELNDKKKDKKLSFLDQDSVRRICAFEDLDSTSIDRIISNADFPALKEMRLSAGLIDKIKSGRREFVSCTGYWSLD